MAGNNLTLTSPTFDTTAQKFGSAALNGGYGATSGPLFNTTTFAIEGLVKLAANPSAAVVALGSAAKFGWLGVNASGQAECFIGINGGYVSFQSSIVLSNNAWHHLAASTDGTFAGTRFFVDGVSIAQSSTQGSSGIVISPDVFNVRSDAGGALSWPGEVDEVAVWPTNKYTAAFTPPTSAYTGNEGMVALYHLDSNGTDSSAVGSPVAIAPNNAAISYSLFNWLVSSTSAQTINAGAKFSTVFSGTSCTLNFNVSGDAGSYLPMIWYRIDGLYWQIVRVATTVVCAMPTETTAWPKHTLEVIVKSTSEWQTRWSPQSTAVVFTGLTLAANATVQSFTANGAKNVLLLADSIGEGYHGINANGSGADDPAGSDALSGWVERLGAALGCNISNVSFGGQGVTVGGQGGVPALTTSYALLWSGQARSFTPAPDLIVIVHGGNDANQSVATATFQAAYTSLLNSLLSACPTSKIAAVRPFGIGSGYAPQIQAAVAACSAPGRVTYVDTTGLFDTSLSVDAVHPLGVASVSALAPGLSASLRPILTPAPQPTYRRMFH